MKRIPVKFDYTPSSSLLRLQEAVGKYKGAWRKENPSSTEKSWKKPDIYLARPIERLQDMLTGLGIVGLLSYFFYRSIVAFFLMLPLAGGYVWMREKDRRCKRYEQMERQFMDALLALSGALKAGYSIENALEEAGKEMEILYGVEAPISREFRLIRGKLKVNRRPEEALMEFADRSHLEDAAVFAEVFAIVGRAGGDLISVIGRTTEMIGEKLRAQQEIRTAIRARQLEQKIMNGMPLGILAYMDLVSPGYLDPLYGNLGGVVVMSIGLAVYGAAYLLGRKLTEIEV